MRLAAVGFILFLPFLAMGSPLAQTGQMTLPAGDIYELRIRCGSGSLYITNAEWQDKIRVFVEIEAEEETKIEFQDFSEKYVDLKLERKGRRAILTSKLKKVLLNSVGTLLNPMDAKINLTVEVPSGVDLFINDGSGAIHIQHFNGHMVIQDDSGGIILENVIGNVTVADGSGKIVMEDIQGNVEIKDGSGIIDVDKIRGDVRVTDGSGEISIQHVDGNVTVMDESGEIGINDISGNVLIRGRGSGEMNIERVKGQIVTQN
ncbi:MAG: hypothetical protein QNL14_06080 [Deltaproteobacteria bacterium]|nr:hypothetical protein [Deltaproteobacteria bacterium]